MGGEGDDLAHSFLPLADRHMSGHTWTVFGMGNFIWDIFDAIESNREIVSYIVLNTKVRESLLAKVPTEVKIIDIYHFTPATEKYCFGFIDSRKEALLTQLEAFNLHFENIVHRFSYVSPLVRLGKGNFIGAGVVLAPFVQLADFNFINRSVSVGHDTRIGKFNHLGPGVTVCGNCIIGDRNFLGAGSVVIEGITIKDRIILGGGAAAVKDLIDPTTYVGTPGVPAQSLPSKQRG